MVSHQTVKKRRKGGKVKGSMPKNKNLLVLKNIKNKNIKNLYDKTKTPVQNLKELGLSYDSNNFQTSKCYGENNERTKLNYQSNKDKKDNIAFIGMTALPTDSTSLNPSNPKRRKMSEFDQKYIKDNIEKYGTNYKAMERDIKLNYFQYTEQKMKTLCEKFVNLTDKDRLIPL
mmetsp:Transcript_12959/g.11741  ORF Transcript_12959/g.11741 Transcript_12959/m.11741 type:complete len:173 (+) Transcript_12959:46-564(+)